MEQRLASQSIHKLFAANLREHCARFASIAELCRLTGINRAQFNRYLSGQNLPNPSTMAKLCAVLAVPETTLFASQKTRSESLARLLPASSQPIDLPTGYYFLYTPLVGHTQDLLRILVKVTHDQNQVRFTRHTVFANGTAKGKRVTVGRHGGVVIADGEAVTLLGSNGIFPHEISTIRIANGLPMAQAPRFGLAILRSPESSMACRVGLEWCGSRFSDGKRALAKLGKISLNDASISTTMRQMMEQIANNSTIITAMDYDAVLGFTLNPPAPVIQSAQPIIHIS